MPKQTPKQTPGDERGSLAHPPWLTGDPQRKRTPLGRGKQERADDAESHARGGDDVSGAVQSSAGPEAVRDDEHEGAAGSRNRVALRAGHDSERRPADRPVPPADEHADDSSPDYRTDSSGPPSRGGEEIDEESIAPPESGISAPAGASAPDTGWWVSTAPPEISEQPDATVESEAPVEVSTEREWGAAPAVPPTDHGAETDARVEVSTQTGWEPQSPVEPETPTVPEQPTVSAAGELDDIELRAAALLEQMHAKRAQEETAPAEPEAAPVAVESQESAPQQSADDWAPSDSVSPPVTPKSVAPEEESSPTAVEEPAVEEPAEVVAPAAEWRWTDFMPGAESAPQPAAEDQPADHRVPPGASSAENGPDPSVTHRPVIPPWQVPGSTATAGRDEAAHDATAAQESPTTSAPSGRPTPGPRRRPGALPPFPPPPPPGPFPPPPWWPGPPPGQRVPPATPRPVAGQPVRARRAAPPGGPPAPVGPPPSYQPFQVPPPIDEAEVDNLDRFAPPSGWRRAVHRATGGHLNPGASRKQRRHEHLLAEIRQPIVGDFRIAVLSIKGGVGKTTTTFGLGSALATVRHDRVIAVDANPDRGTLGERVGDMSTRSTVRDLLADPNINRYADVRNHTLMATSRLEVLASEQDPAVSEVFGADDYRRTIDILRHFYNIILTDCGTGIMHSAMSAVLDLAHTIVLVSSPAIDAARSASATLDWLMQHGHSGLVREAHVVLSASRPGSAALKLDKVYEHFQTRCRSIHLIPFDPHLAEGADVDFDRLRPATRQAYLELAGSVSENFGRLRGAREQA
nr:AAA family ATPase [Mycobacterium kiyosense]